MDAAIRHAIAGSRNVRIAVLIKQIPAPEQLRLDRGRVVRDGVALEVNAYCRRANAKAVELAGPDGEVVVFTMGPPSADEAPPRNDRVRGDPGRSSVRPCVRPAATLWPRLARWAAAIGREGRFGLVLAGLNSLDADTGQVPAELAEMLGMPFASWDPRHRGHRANVHCPNWRPTTDIAPSRANCRWSCRRPRRLCDPSKAPPEHRELVANDRITMLTAAELGLAADQVGAAGSPTSVGAVRMLDQSRQPAVVSSAKEAVDMLEELGAFAAKTDEPDIVADAIEPGGLDVWCFFTESGVGSELLGEAAELASEISGTVTAITGTPVPFWARGHGRGSCVGHSRRNRTRPSGQMLLLTLRAWRGRGRYSWRGLARDASWLRLWPLATAGVSPAMRSGWKWAPMGAWSRGSLRLGDGWRYRFIRIHRCRWPHCGRESWLAADHAQQQIPSSRCWPHQGLPSCAVSGPAMGLTT